MSRRHESSSSRLRRLRAALGDTAFAVLLVAGLLLFFWLIWDPPR